MNYLKRGVCIHSEIDSTVRSRVSVNSGVRVKLEGRGEKCRKYYLPKQDWRPLKNEELSTLLRKTTKPNYYSTVGLVKLPGSSTTNASQIIEKLCKIHSGQIVPDARIVDLESEWKLTLREILSNLNRYIISDSQLAYSGLMFYPPNQLTVTRDANEGQRIVGLHVDNWDELPLKDRNSSTNRICINLGQQSRYFLFINLPLAQVADLVSTENIQVPNVSKGLADLFMHLWPEYPIVRIELLPGEAYIAPTENIIHDGSNFGSTSVDISLTFRGFWSPHRRHRNDRQ